MAAKKNAEKIFNRAVELSDAGEQAAYLDEACGADEKLRTQVEALLRWHAEAGSFLESPALDPDVTLATPVVEGAGTVIGRYKLLERIGEGGMATVYMAEQKHPIRRRVALKIIKLGMDTKQVIARFEAERQALAMMDHPNIAKVFDAGTTETGRPYFVMELVRGVPITEFCDKNHLNMKERLDLFVCVCQAVQHAHQKGIIHRDIKPTNIMVTLHDGQPVVKVIDFGIAKAVNQQLTEKTVFTRYSQMIGTPEYMSPEQAEMSGLDIDTRTDVFSLGVLLYELLTGTTPFDSEYLLSKGYGEMQRIIREVEPTRPSTKLSTLGDTLTDIAKHRRTSPEVLCKLIRTDLDWIVMKTLEKDRQRRYESVSELAADIKRHLNHEPVLAGRPSTAYKIQKFVKRNKTLCISSVAVAVVLVLAVIVSSHQAWVAQKARRAEADARVVMEDERDRAKKAEQDAQTNLYDSLVREARATRIARETGYRDEVFNALKQARDLNVPQKDLVELRSEAVACLGDYVGLQPVSLMELPEGPNTPEIWWAVLHPTDPIAAIGLSDGAVILKDLHSAKEIQRFECEYATWGLGFAPSGNTLVSLHVPKGDASEDWSKGWELDAVVANFFVRAKDTTWVKSNTVKVPNAIHLMPTTDGFKVIVVDEASETAHLADLLTGSILHEVPFPGDINKSPVFDVTADGRLSAAADIDPNSDTSIVDIWDLTEKQHLVRLEPGLARGTCLKFSQDGQYLAFLSTSGGLVYSTETWKPIGHLTEHFERQPEAVFLPGSTVLAYSPGWRFFLWDFQKKWNLATFEQSSGQIRWFSVSADGSTLVNYGAKQAWVYSLDVAHEKLVLSGHSASIPGIAFSPDGSRLASVGKDRRLRVWNSATGHMESDRSLEGQGQGVSYSADGRWIITTDFDRERIYIWDAKTMAQVHKFGSELKAMTWLARLTGDNRYLLTCTGGGGRGAVTVWSCRIGGSAESQTQFETERLRSFQGYSTDVVLAPDDQHFAFVKNKHKGRGELYRGKFTDDEDPQLLASDLPGWNPQMIDITPDGEHILVIGANRCVVAYDIRSGQKRRSFPTLGEEAGKGWTGNAIRELSPDGTRFSITSELDYAVDMWDPRDGRFLYSLPYGEGFDYSHAWSPDGKRLAISRSNGDIEIWNIAEIERVLAELKLAP